jgi:hypothetical protein
MSPGAVLPQAVLYHASEEIISWNGVAFKEIWIKTGEPLPIISI